MHAHPRTLLIILIKILKQTQILKYENCQESNGVVLCKNIGWPPWYFIPHIYATWNSGSDLCNSFYFPNYVVLSTIVAADIKVETVLWTWSTEFSPTDHRGGTQRSNHSGHYCWCQDTEDMSKKKKKDSRCEATRRVLNCQTLWQFIVYW